MSDHEKEYWKRQCFALGIGWRYGPFEAGKKIGDKVWIHRTVAQKYSNKIDLNFMKQTDFDYDVVRFDLKTRQVTCFKCDDFDGFSEPSILRGMSVHNGIQKYYTAPKDPLIYHHKWLFVPQDYQGFDVEQEIKRSIEWKSVIGKNKDISSRIGRLSYWVKIMDELGINDRQLKTYQSRP